LQKESDDEEGDKPTFSDDELPSDLEDLKMEMSNAGTSSNKDKKGKKGKKGKKKHSEDQDQDPQQKVLLFNFIIKNLTILTKCMCL
jgi:hypothetical protein